MIGKSLSHYQTIESQTRSSMGEVFREQDAAPHLAIKALPAEFALDSERPARFGHETERLAPLNHQNIQGEVLP